jgi:uncharacterized protein (TIGR03085 family)
MSLARSERSALADLFLRLGPDAPTLDEGWTTADLAAHLLLRERRPDAALGAFLPPLAGWTEKVSAGYKAQPWPHVVQLYRSGPPSWNPMGWGKVDQLANSAEMFIHHEDARRGSPGWEPRVLRPAETDELRGILGSFLVRQLLRKAPMGVRADAGAGPVITLKAGEPAVTLSGAPGEILLWVSGRDACLVELTGADADVAALRRLHRSM